MSVGTIGARASPRPSCDFCGVLRTLLGDNARALVLGRDRATGTVNLHPAYLTCCRDWDMQPRACARIARGPKARRKRCENTSSAMR
jgi:hypothetical protein